MVIRSAKRQIKSIETVKRLEDRRLEIAAQRRTRAFAEIKAAEDRVAVIENEIARQFADPNPVLAPLVGNYVRSARSEIQRLKAKIESLRREAEDLEAQVRSSFRKAQTLELTGAAIQKKQKQAADRAAAVSALEDVLRRSSVGTGR